MAITKIHPIKSTLKKALDYIENPAKTDEKMLVSSFACSYETADIEFELLLSQAMQKGNNLAHHLIQSFAPGETTPEQAHEIGRQLADEVLQGKYPYVLTTHIDKGHVHNHIIFCAVDMVNQRKYVSSRQSYAYIRRTSDRLCKEHGLSVVMPGQDRGKSYAEWDAHRKGTSWKAKLKAAIDAAIPQAKDFDDFLRLLQEQSYEVKRGKYVSFRAPGQERFTRCKTLGEAYTEEAITERIKGRFAERKPKENRKISLRIDLENSIKAQQSAGYEKWAKLHNLKQAARTLNFLTEHEIESYPDLESRVAEITAASTEAAAALKAAERRLAEMAVLIKDVTTCKELHPLLQEYQRAADKKQFRRKHEGTLILYVIAVLTDSADPQNYWRVLKKRLKDEGNETITNCNGLKMTAPDGKKRKTDVANTEQLLRIIQSIPSPKAEPFKAWLAMVGKERIEETIDPEQAIDRALDTYLKKGYSEEWIHQRLLAIRIRNELTDEWKKRGVQKGKEYAILTDEISRAWSGMTTGQYKRLKGLTKENLRDNILFFSVIIWISSWHITRARIAAAMGSTTVSERLRSILKIPLFHACGVEPTSEAISPTLAFTLSNRPERLPVMPSIKMPFIHFSMISLIKQRYLLSRALPCERESAA